MYKINSISTGFYLIILMMLGCSNNSNAESNLNQRLQTYKKCFNEKDYICMSTMVLPSVMEEVGGVEGFIEIMKNLPAQLAESGLIMDASKMKFNDRGPIISHEGIKVSVVPTFTPIILNGINGSIESSIIAFSNNNGENWFFIDGGDDGKMQLANSDPEILQKINIPVSKLKIGETTLVQKNGQWAPQ